MDIAVRTIDLVANEAGDSTDDKVVKPDPGNVQLGTKDLFETVSKRIRNDKEIRDEDRTTIQAKERIEPVPNNDTDLGTDTAPDKALSVDISNNVAKDFAP